MIKIIKHYIKYKILSLIMGRLIHYLTEKNKFLVRQVEWESKENSNPDCISETRFNRIKSSQVSFSNYEMRKNHYKVEVIEEIIELIKKM